MIATSTGKSNNKGESEKLPLVGLEERVVILPVLAMLQGREYLLPDTVRCDMPDT